MEDIKKVIKGFTVCLEHGSLNGEDCHGHYEYTDNLEDIIKANDYSKKCPYNGCRTGCIKTLAKDTLALLKEQENEIADKEITVDVSIPEQLLLSMRYDPSEDVVACTSCLICGKDIPLRRYESGPMVCSECKKAVTAMKKEREKENE